MGANSSCWGCAPLIWRREQTCLHLYMADSPVQYQFLKWETLTRDFWGKKETKAAISQQADEFRDFIKWQTYSFARGFMAFSLHLPTLKLHKAEQQFPVILALLDFLNVRSHFPVLTITLLALVWFCRLLISCINPSCLYNRVFLFSR